MTVSFQECIAAAGACEGSCGLPCLQRDTPGANLFQLAWEHLGRLRAVHLHHIRGAVFQALSLNWRCLRVMQLAADAVEAAVVSAAWPRHASVCPAAPRMWAAGQPRWHTAPGAAPRWSILLVF